MRLVDEALAAIAALTRAELLEVDSRLHELLEAPAPARRVVVPDSEHQVGAETRRLEFKRCGKVRCRCAQTKGHGPYWYGYRREGGRLRVRYIGKTLPATEGGANGST